MFHCYVEIPGVILDSMQIMQIIYRFLKTLKQFPYRILGFLDLGVHGVILGGLRLS